METKKQKINLIEIYPIIKEKIDNGGTVQLPITGKSMRPLLVWGRDTVEIVKCDNPKKGDIIFYLRDNGQFVLHRIIGTDENGYVLCGDNQWVKEYGIKDHNIVAVVACYRRHINPTDPSRSIQAPRTRIARSSYGIGGYSRAVGSIPKLYCRDIFPARVAHLANRGARYVVT